MAYSWGFEVPAAWVVENLGLMGLSLLHCLLVTAVVVALHRLLASLILDFTLAVGLTAAAVVAMNAIFTPRPWLLTILFFILELHVILRVRAGGSTANSSGCRLSSAYGPIFTYRLCMEYSS